MISLWLGSDDCRSGCFCLFLSVLASAAICTLSLHDALPIWFLVGRVAAAHRDRSGLGARCRAHRGAGAETADDRSEEHTSELQSRQYLVCRLLLEKKKKIRIVTDT